MDVNQMLTFLLGKGKQAPQAQASQPQQPPQ
jgi:hypothetical protein